MLVVLPVLGHVGAALQLCLAKLPVVSHCMTMRQPIALSTSADPMTSTAALVQLPPAEPAHTACAVTGAGGNQSQFMYALPMPLTTGGHAKLASCALASVASILAILV